MYKNKNNIYTFQTTYIKKLFYFVKSILISLTSKEVLKTLEKNNFGKSALHINIRKITILSKIIGLAILK